MSFSRKARVCFLLFAFSNAAFCNSLNVYLEEFPPYNYFEDGKLKGINSELVQHVCIAAEINCKFTSLPWTRAWHLALNEPDSGLYSTGMSSQRQSLFKWVGPLVSSSTTLYKLKSRTDIVFSEENKTKGYSIAVVRDTVTKHIALEQGFANPEDFIEFSYLEEYIPLFFAGKIDLIPGSVITTPFHLPRLGYDFNELQAVAHLNGAGLGNYLALNKAVSDEIVQKMNLALVKFKEQGKVEQVIQKYSPTDVTHVKQP